MLGSRSSRQPGKVHARKHLDRAYADFRRKDKMQCVKIENAPACMAFMSHLRADTKKPARGPAGFDLSCLTACLARVREVLIGKIPIDQLGQKRGHIVRAGVLIVEIIRVFPDIHGQERGDARFGDRGFRIWCFGDG